MKTKKLNQAMLAEKAMVSKSMISQILAGKKGLGRKSIAGLIKALKLNPVILLTGTQEEIIAAIKNKLQAHEPIVLDRTK